METYTIIIIIFGIITFLLICLLYFLNQLMIYKNKVEFQFKSINSHMEEVISLLDSFSLWLESNYSEEKDLLKKIHKFCFQFKEEKDVMAKLSFVDEMDKLVKGIYKLEKVYPKILKENEYLSFKEEYENHKSEIMYAIDLFNQGVEDYNRYKKKRIVSMLNAIVHYPDYVLYKK